MKRWRKTLALLAAMALLACGLALAEGAPAEAMFLGVWSFYEAEIEGEVSSAQALEMEATLEIEPGAVAFITEGGTDFYTSRLEDDALVLSNALGRYACRLDDQWHLYMTIAADDGTYVTMRFEKLEDYDGAPVSQAPAEESPDALVDALMDSLGMAGGSNEVPGGQDAAPDGGETLNSLEDELGSLSGGADGTDSLENLSDELNGAQPSAPQADAESSRELVAQLLAMCNELPEIYDVREFPDIDWALISSTLESSDRAFIHKYESATRYSTTTFFLEIDDYQSDAPKVQPELMVTYSRDDAPLNIKSVTLIVGSSTYTFTGDMGYNVDQDEQGYSEYVHLKIDRQNQGFMGGIAQYIVDLPGDDLSASLESARARLILHGDEDVEVELGEGFFLDYTVVIVNTLSTYDLSGCLYETGGTAMSEGY